MKGNAVLQGILTLETSTDRAERARFTRFAQRNRAFMEMILGSSIPAADREELYMEVLTDVLSGESVVGEWTYPDEESFTKALRKELRQQCENLLKALGK